MRKIIFILLFSISFACSTHKQITEKDVTNSNHQPLINYQKLNNKLIKKFFKSETDKHKLGQIRFIDYFPSGRIKKRNYLQKQKW